MGGFKCSPSEMRALNTSHTKRRVQTNHKYYIYNRVTYQASYLWLGTNDVLTLDPQIHFPWPAADPCKLQPCHEANELWIKPLNNTTQLESFPLVKKARWEREADEADYAGIAYRVNRLAECECTWLWRVGLGELEGDGRRR